MSIDVQRWGKSHVHWRRRCLTLILGVETDRDDPGAAMAANNAARFGGDAKPRRTSVAHELRLPLTVGLRPKEAVFAHRVTVEDSQILPRAATNR
eukprot:scaffold1744_cov252-Pinguiococcus_pyrenoidosus.AAC.15